MNVSIIGAARTRNGIGEYIGKYFHQQGGQVTSVLGRSKETSLQASLALGRYGIQARPYTDFDEMVNAEKTDAVVISSPASTHYDYLLRCIDSGLHVFCEKPFIWDSSEDLRKQADDVFERAYKKGVVIAMNSQWAFSIEAYEAVSGKIVLQPQNTFFAEMSPPFSGRPMIPESVPHVLSLLYCFLGEGEMEHLTFTSETDQEMEIAFEYLFGNRTCDVLIRLRHQASPPRSFSFGLNDRIVSRKIDLENYGIYFNYKNETMKIADPLKLSVGNFIEAVEKKKEPFIGTLHILHNLSLLKEIDEAFGEFEQRAPRQPRPVS